MVPETAQKFRATEATTPDTLAEAQALRGLCFGLEGGLDTDLFDHRHRHFIVRDAQSGQAVCCFRLLVLDGAQIDDSYAAQYYHLHALASYDGRMMELGRFCVHPDARDPDIVRVAWAALTDVVDREDIKLLFGCSSFSGTDKAPFLDAFALLKARHLAPTSWRPKIKAPDVFRFGALLRRKPDLKKAMLRMPPLLRTYLMMGGWVSDHAVVDRHMNTLHVFTGLEIGRIPEGRKRLLRGLV